MQQQQEERSRQQLQQGDMLRQIAAGVVIEEGCLAWMGVTAADESSGQQQQARGVKQAAPVTSERGVCGAKLPLDDP